MLVWLLTRIGSWTSARFDQHLRDEFGDELAGRLLAWLGDSVGERLRRPGLDVPGVTRFRTGAPHVTYDESRMRLACSACGRMRRTVEDAVIENFGVHHAGCRGVSSRIDGSTRVAEGNDP